MKYLPASIKKNICILSLWAITLLSAHAQQLPQISTHSVLKQTVGLTDITIQYNRPTIKGRKVWDGLVPYDKIWRTGANEATVISFSDDVWLNGNKIKAGEYALFTIPTAGTWTILFNRNTKSWGTNDYIEEENVLAFKVKPFKDKFEETFGFEISNITRNTAEIFIKWEKVVVPITIKVEVDEKVNRNIDEAIKTANNRQSPEDWSVYANCAEYCLRNNIRHDEAMQWIEKSIALSSNHFRPIWLKADMLALKNDFRGAIELAKKSIELGMAERGEKFSYKGDLEKSITLWKSKMN